MSDLMTENSVDRDKIRISRKERRKSRKVKRKVKKRKRFKILLAICILLTGMYSSLVFLDIPVISDLRDIYIETAMTTATHQWLATLFFPDSLINRVMSKKVDNSNLVSVTNIDKEPNDSKDINSGQAGDILNQKNLKVGDKDYAGNDVVINDIEQGIIISKVSGNKFKGRIALIDDPKRVFVGTTDKKGISGRAILDFISMYDAVLGINASGFNDAGGVGNGGSIIGVTYENGQKWGEYTSGYGTIAFDKNDRLIVGGIRNWDKYNIRDGAQFSPVLISDNKMVISGSAGWGLQPRTIVGQRKDGVVIFLVIDGRQPAYSLGATMEDCAQVMQSYGAVTAAACDGGSSSIMAYDGKILTKCSSPSKIGRLLPNAFLVRKK
ncbi:phosphodiester glycosidase family protein [Haloimpatiens lingqiaonensis]|uniref:phosphodiester glycosidase family protein n=1 Tax=Haloimpatiens lingqiaonensis TaxID=1380675 RepID=UPI0010FF0AC9|nr:phosphodiester glycosidase family protein [Haloimpatiens lingqiaonensis]